MKQLIASLLVLCFSTTVMADPVFLKKGQTYTATEDSIVFTTIEEQKIRLRLTEADYMDEVIKTQSNTIGSLKTQIDLQNDISDKYRKAWLDSDDRLTKILQSNNRGKFMYMALGIALTIGAGFAVGQAAK